MTELSNLGSNTTKSPTDLVPVVHGQGASGFPGLLQTVTESFIQGFFGLSSIGTTAVTTSDLLVLDHGGSVVTATVAQVLAAGGGALPPSAGLLATNSGGTATAVVVGAGLSETGGTLTATSTTIPAAGIVLSTGSALTDLAIGANLTLAGGTLSAAGSALTVTDGTHTVASTGTLNVIGGTVGGSAGSATLTVTGGGGGGGAVTLGDPINGMSMVGRTEYNRPLLSACTVPSWSVGAITEYNSGGLKAGPIVLGVTGQTALTIAHGQTGDFSVDCLCTVQKINNNTGGGPQTLGGVYLLETSSGKGIVFGGLVADGYGTTLVVAEIANDGTVSSITNSQDSFHIAATAPVWLKFSYSTTTGVFAALISSDALVWSIAFSALDFSAYFTGVPDRMGFYFNNGNELAGSGMSGWQLFATSP
jgi:hypothetical protein